MDAAGRADRPLPGDGHDAHGRGTGGRLLTVGRLAASVGLSRTTLLHYDRIGLLTPSARSPAGYRLYDEDDVARLEAVCRFRRAGLALAVIRRLLDSPRPALAEALADRVRTLDAEIGRLRAEQRFIVARLSTGDLGVRPFLDRAQLVDLLERTGVSAEQRARWHAAAERADGALHQAFLEFLCLPDEEIARVRSAAPARAAEGDAP